jgi:hypothetical protein
VLELWVNLPGGVNAERREAASKCSTRVPITLTKPMPEINFRGVNGSPQPPKMPMGSASKEELLASDEMQELLAECRRIERERASMRAAMIDKVISGGQTGADRAALDAALACGVPHGGWCPKGRLAEDGVIPDRYELTETEGSSYLARTERNVKRSDGTVILTMEGLTGGSARTADFARRHRKPFLHLELQDMSDAEAASLLANFAGTHDVRRLNVAGPSAGSEPAIYARVLSVMCRVLSGREGVNGVEVGTRMEKE